MKNQIDENRKKVYIVLFHSMAMGNLNKSKGTMQTATTALQVAP